MLTFPTRVPRSLRVGGVRTTGGSATVFTLGEAVNGPKASGCGTATAPRCEGRRNWQPLGGEWLGLIKRKRWKGTKSQGGKTTRLAAKRTRQGGWEACELAVEQVAQDSARGGMDGRIRALGQRSGVMGMQALVERPREAEAERQKGRKAERGRAGRRWSTERWTARLRASLARVCFCNGRCSSWRHAPGMGWGWAGAKPCRSSRKAAR